MGRFNLTLAHAFPPQERYPLFSDVHQIASRTDTPFTAWRFLRTTKRWLEANANRFDVFHGLRAYHETVAPAFLAQRMGLPAVVKPAAHRADLIDKRGWLAPLRLQRRRREMLKSLSGVIAISRAIAEELLTHGIPPRKIAQIPNGVDTDLFEPVDEATRRRQREALGWRDIPTLLFVGAVLPRKRPHLLVEAIAFVKRRGYDCQLVIAGPTTHDAAYVNQIQQRAKELGVQDLIIMAGFKAEIAPLYRASDVFGFPTVREGLPNALLEAMASGLPSIVTAFPGLDDLLTSNREGSITGATGQEIAEALEAYLKTQALRKAHGDAARARVLAHFGTAAVLDAHERLFRRIMAGGDAAN
jgi:glycosyltransferase involved in cell wall biosynthesis